MDVNKFIGSLDIFQQEDDQYGAVKATLATTIALGLLFFPASALRWDGSIRSPLDKTPLPKNELTRLQPNAALNRTIRFLSAVVGLGLSGYALLIDSKDLQRAPLRRKKEEARSILEDELINAKIIELLPEEKAEAPATKALSPMAQQALKLMMGSKGKGEAPEEENLEALAAKFKKGKPAEAGAVTTVATSTLPDTKEAIHVTNDAIQQAKQPYVEGQDNFSKFRAIGESIIQSMTVSDKSVLIASGTGTGKTTTEREYLKRLKAKYPNITIWAFLNKADVLPHVTNRTLFEPGLLTQIYEEESGVTLRDALTPLFRVFEIFTHRRQLPEPERKRLKETEPIRLILGDWFYTYQELQARLNKKDFQLVLSMIRGIITIGRDQGVGLIVDTQSAALEALGLANDQSIRLSLDIYSQGFIYYEDGEVKGELETIRNLFTLNGICSPENRKYIKEAYDLLANSIENGSLKTPIIFTSVGARPRLGIVPPLVSGADEITTPPTIIQPNTGTDILTVIPEIVEEKDLN